MDCRDHVENACKVSKRLLNCLTMIGLCAVIRLNMVGHDTTMTVGFSFPHLGVT